MLISIVIPVYNVSKDLLVRCIESVLRQKDHSDTEIIIVDDGSEAANAASYQEISDQHSEIKYFRKENAGPSAARNYGVEKAEGEYVFFMDADDYATDRCLEQAKAMIEKHHSDIVFGYVYKDLADEGTIRHASSDSDPEDMIIRGEEDISALMNHILGYEDPRFRFGHGYLSDGPCCRLFRRSLFDTTSFDTVPRWNEDTLWNIELLKKCKTVAICKSMWYVYAVRKGSAMQGFRSNCYEEFMYITEKVSSVGHSVWNGSIDKGIAYRVWHDIFILSRGYIFNQKNTDPFPAKYAMLKRAVRSGAYRQAVRSVRFDAEQSISKRAVKTILNTAMKMHCFCLVYFLIRLYVGKA